MKGLLVALAGGVLVVLAFAAFAPATLVDREVAARTGGVMRVADARGTLWHGRGALASSDGAWRMPIAWRLRPLPLVSGVADVTLEPVDATAATPRGRLQLSHDRLLAEQLALALPVRGLASAIGAQVPRSGGEVALRADSFTIASAANSGAATFEWHNARLLVRHPPALDLGRVTARLSVRGSDFAGPVDNRGGEVSVKGDLVLGVQRVSLSLEVTPAATASPAMRAALASLGSPDASGAIRLRIERSHR